MKKLLLAFCATAALFTLKAEDDILLETVFSDPTSFHTPAVAKNVTTFKNVKVYHTKSYPLLIIPVTDYDGKSPVTVKIRAARDNSFAAKLGLICQVRNNATKKMLYDNMQIKNTTENFADYTFKINPAKLLPGTKNFRLLIYTVAKKGNIYLEKVTVSVSVSVSGK